MEPWQTVPGHEAPMESPPRRCCYVSGRCRVCGFRDSLSFLDLPDVEEYDVNPVNVNSPFGI